MRQHIWQDIAEKARLEAEEEEVMAFIAAQRGGTLSFFLQKYPTF